MALLSILAMVFVLFFQFFLTLFPNYKYNNMRIPLRFTLQLAKLAFTGLLCLGSAAQAQILFDNGPIFNSPSTGPSGADESVLYNTTFGMTTLGTGNQNAAFNHVADDFDVTGCGWRIDSIVFFAYQTGSSLTSTMSGVYFRVWDDLPDGSGSAVVFGDSTTNRLTSSRWSGTYRVSETAVGTTRPIMRNVCATPGLVLTPGNFWIDWASAGSLASGPWAPPRTPVGVAMTGNARQRTGNSWNPIVDGGSTDAQGLPFIVYGVADTAPSAAFNFLANGGNYAFTDLSTGSPSSWSWDFGDGGTSTAANPSHAFTSTGTFTVCLTVTNICGTGNYCENITVSSVGVDPARNTSIAIGPNPADNEIRISTEISLTEAVVEVHDIRGAVVKQVIIGAFSEGTTQTIGVNDVAPGIYFVKVKANEMGAVQKIWIH